MKKFLQLLNSNKNPRRPYRKRRVRRRRRTNPMISSRPQTLGYGTSSVLCNKQYKFEQEDGIVHTINLAETVLNQPEFVLRKALYKYMKIQYIRLMFFPYNYNNSNASLYFQVAYNMNPETSNLTTDDQSKCVGPVMTRPKSFIYLPPNVTFTNFQSVPYNFKEWLPSGIGIVNMPITLVFQKNSVAADKAFPCEIQIKVLFRGGNTVTQESMKEINNCFEKKLLETIKETNEEYSNENEEDISNESNENIEDDKEITIETNKETKKETKEVTKEVTVETNKETSKDNIEVVVEPNKKNIVVNHEKYTGSKKTIPDLKLRNHCKK